MKCSLEIQLIVCGIKLEQLYEGQLFAIKKCEVISSGKSVSDCVKFDYKVSVKADSSVPEQEYVNRVINQEVDLFTQSLSLLLMYPSQLISYEAKLGGIAVKPEPSRQYAPSLYSLAEMFKQVGPTSHVLSVLPSMNFWSLLENIISSYRQSPDYVSRHLAVPLRWFKKGNDEFNISDRLMAFWISFNALYANPEINSEPKAIEKYINNNMDSIMAKRYANDNKKLLETLSQFPIELGREKKKREIAQELADLLEAKANTQSYVEIAKKTALTIYGIRNNLFHGEYNPSSENDQKPIATAEELLSSLGRELIAKEILGKSPPTMNCFPQKQLVIS